MPVIITSRATATATTSTTSVPGIGSWVEEDLRLPKNRAPLLGQVGSSGVPGGTLTARRLPPCLRTPWWRVGSPHRCTILPPTHIIPRPILGTIPRLLWAFPVDKDTLARGVGEEEGMKTCINITIGDRNTVEEATAKNRHHAASRMRKRATWAVAGRARQQALVVPRAGTLDGRIWRLQRVRQRPLAGKPTTNLPRPNLSRDSSSSDRGAPAGQLTTTKVMLQER